MLGCQRCRVERWIFRVTKLLLMKQKPRRLFDIKGDHFPFSVMKVQVTISLFFHRQNAQTFLDINLNA